MIYVITYFLFIFNGIRATHGYFTLNVRAASIQCDCFYVSSITKKEHTEYWTKGLSSQNGTNRITKSDMTAPSPPKSIQDIPAPMGKIVPALSIF